ncbi:lipopolysaccharide biosynthesis protein [Falsiroseomonas sp. HW251]|uniref:lipopolysaccharide biosynthesis protein n=1 Tax=Falsiroseomonas sp. HW251 TaxID=3390998 RepID=UPI003D31B948
MRRRGSEPDVPAQGQRHDGATELSATTGRAFVGRAARLGVSGLPFLLRLASLAGKFGLSLYILRYLSFGDLGLYGLVFSASMIAVVLFGGRIDHDLARRVVGMPAEEGRALLRDQTIFFLLNYAAALPLVLVFHQLSGETLAFLLLAYLICCLESYSNLLFVTTNFLGRPILANLAFFVRAGLWAFIVIGIGLLVPSTRVLWFVLALWVAGTAASIALNLIWLDVARWPGLRAVPLDRARIRHALRISFPIWIGSIGLAGGSYLDRFVLGAFLDLKAVGLATFYTSFTAAIVTLVSSGVLNVVAPKLVASAARGDAGGYDRELRRAGLTVTALGTTLCLLVLAGVGQVASLLQQREIEATLLAFGLLMAATVVRLVAETAFFGLYSRHKDRAIWLGNTGFLAASLLLNLMLVPWLGLTGLGIAAILANLFLLAVRRDGLRGLPAA